MPKSRTKNFARKRSVQAIVTIAVVVVALPLLYPLARDVIADVIAGFYQHEIENAFPQFYKFDPSFKDAGITFQPMDSDSGPICENGPFSSSSPCTESRITSLDIIPSAKFQQSWQQKAPLLDRSIEDDGWQRKVFSNEDLPLANLFNTTPPPYQVGTVYNKQIHGADCYIAFNYFVQASFDVTEYCERTGTKTHFW